MEQFFVVIDVSWASVLGKEMPCQREFGKLVDVSQNFLTYAEGEKA